MRVKVIGSIGVFLFATLTGILLPVFVCNAYVNPVSFSFIIDNYNRPKIEQTLFHFKAYILKDGQWEFYNAADLWGGSGGVSGYGTTVESAYGDTYKVELEKAPGVKVTAIRCYTWGSNPPTSFEPPAVIFTPLKTQDYTCSFEVEKTLDKTPVLIVPGLAGTELKKENELLWADAVRMANPFNDDSFMDSLAFLGNLKPLDNNVISSGVIKSIKVNIEGVEVIIYNYTEKLIEEFVGQGYVERETLFTFPYDWRYGVSGVNLDGKTNVDLLQEKIQNILQQTGADKVDVVAHSLGGLIFKKYVMDTQGENHIGKAVFVGVPNTGSPKSMKVLLQGDNLNVWGLNDAEIKKISQNMPAVYDLLPSQKYYDVKGSFIETIKGDDFNDLNYNETKSFLTDTHGLNSLALNNAVNLHTQNFDNFDLRTAGVDVYAIDGCRAATLGKVVEKDGEYLRPTMAPGDNTVPLESATNLPINQENKFYALVSDHGKMPSQQGIRQQIVNIISGSSLDLGKDFLHGDRITGDIITQDISKCNLNGKAISVFSPVDIFVTDQNGNNLGLSEDKSVMNEIPNADFEIWGDHKFVYLPTDNGQTYTINLQGTGAGTFTLLSDDIINNQTTKSQVFYNLPVTTSLTGQVNLSDNGTTLSLGGKTISPNIILTGQQAGDVLLLPSSKDECKKNGWKVFEKFKNQGQCVSFVETGKLPKN
jgi:pimeloyl-ACP methyl ester carboxylesterase